MPNLRFAAQALVTEARTLCTTVVADSDSLFAMTPEPPPAGSNLIISDREIHRLVSRVLSAAANLHKLVAPSVKKRTTDTPRSLVARKQRKEMFRELLQGIGLPETSREDARHTLEHFDERLDRLIVELEGAPPALVTLDLALYSWMPGTRLPVAPDRPVIPLRLYVAESRTYYCFDGSVEQPTVLAAANIGRLRSESEAVLDRIREWFGPEPAEPGGYMFPT